MGIKTRDLDGLTRQKFKERRSTALNQLPPEVEALIGQPVDGKAKVKRPSQDTINAFYQSWEWKRLRLNTLLKYGQRCQCCGATPEHGVRVVVDHIKPLRKHWKLRLDPSNLQVLCDDCNRGKGSHIERDFRKPPHTTRER